MKNSWLILGAWAMPVLSLGGADGSFPLVPDAMRVALFARDPLVRNPGAITFDAQGRLCVGMGPQYRNPSPDTPGDSVVILTDANGDGQADAAKVFATGLNCIQGLAWKGRDLWIANSPDLTVARDLDGDDEADEYVRVYTDLGNLEHGLHGLNWAPDGRLYMSKGNSKGLTTGPDRVAPKPFRELWGVETPGLPDFPPPVTFRKGEYRRNYHDPADDWGREGGVLRCEDGGGNLEIVARGFRNPWDIAFDDSFTWLGTDNDQTGGDKIVSPFFGAHFGWGHPWSFDWKGDDHLPSVPASGPLFEGSGAGVTFCGLPRYPEKYRGVFLINDWLLRQVYLYRPTWRGALLIPESNSLEVLVSAGGGRSMEKSHGRSFDPVDIEIGPDEAIYVSSWGREYGAVVRDGQMVNEGRIYRIWPAEAPPIRVDRRGKERPIGEWNVGELIRDLGSHLPVWRINAQEELVRRGSHEELESLLKRGALPEGLETWTLWTLGRMAFAGLDSGFTDRAISDDSSLNRRIQSIRILAQRGRRSHSLPGALKGLLLHEEPRVRLECLLAAAEVRPTDWKEALLTVAAAETDRVAYYAAWSALRLVLPVEERRALLEDSRDGVRRAALLGLLQDDELAGDRLRVLQRDADAAIAALARRRLDGKAGVVLRGRPLAVPAAKAAGGRVSEDQALALLPSGDVGRGRDLFLGEGGAGCVLCHRLEGRGNAFAPDLTGMGSRADAGFIVRSILEPDAVITEGFAQRTYTTRGDEVFSGILLEETGLGVHVALSNGQTVSLPREEILKEEVSRRSAMPANYAEILSARQVADLATYLRSAPAPAPFTVDRGEDRVEIRLGKQSVATYLFGQGPLTRPAWVNVFTPSGRRVTREFPAPEASDHRWMHPGIAFSFGDLDGRDYWRLKAPVRHLGFEVEPTVKGDEVTFTVRHQYLDAPGSNAGVVCEERVRQRIIVTPEGYQFVVEFELWNDERDFHLGSQEESGLAIRMAPSLAVRGGTGSITNDRGARNEAGTWGNEFGWIDYSGTEAGRRLGVLIVPDAGNPRPSWSHSRDYGVLVANPLPRPAGGDGQGVERTLVRKGERYRLRYSLLVYEKEADKL